MSAALTPSSDPEAPGVFASLPRRPTLAPAPESAAPGQMRVLSFKFSRLAALARLAAWLSLFLRFFLATVVDVLRRVDAPARRAQRLRRAFERRGGTFAKLGLHLSMRVDFMPWEYSVELSRIQDRLPPFPVAAAIERIEAAAGRPLPAIFRRFDPQPIASTSLACVYRAEFHNGEAAIVKVRRPRIGEQFLADLQAFDWLLLLAEFLTIFRPGFTQDMRGEFRDYLLSELDFIEAARRQDSFRRAAAASRVDFFSAPRVYLDLTSEDVVVEAFAAGLWLWELLAAVEQGQAAVLEQARRLNIVPATVARRLLWVNCWAREEHLFFHADPHPTNVILGRDSRLYFINFTATASLSRSQRQALQQNMNYLRQRDPLSMARVSLVLLEPLPSIDVAQLVQELESHNWQLIYALEADPASLTWPERTSAAQWIGMIRLAQKYRIVLDSRVLRLVRATLLAESTAVRLHPTIDFERQYRKFQRYRAEQARRRVTDTLSRQWEGRPNDRLVIRLDRLAQVLSGLLFRTRRMLALPAVNFNALMSKWSFAFYILFRFLFQFAVVSGLAALLAAAAVILQGQVPLDPAYLAGTILANPLYVLVVIVLIFANGRTVLFRMDDKDA
jgi:predicted unusual protein kinase regulating ubiquinone biosynthesis (AarF/ABC1/UbiB family)